jgi:hypothetical protein
VWHASHRNEWLIVGKWEKPTPDTTIELRADGTFEEHGWRMVFECRPVYAPYGTVPLRYESVPTHKVRRRMWGRYRFTARDRMKMSHEGEEEEAKKPLVAESCETPGGFVANDGRDFVLGPNAAPSGSEVAINGDEARVAGEIWKRMK